MKSTECLNTILLGATPEGHPKPEAPIIGVYLLKDNLSLPFSAVAKLKRDEGKEEVMLVSSRSSAVALVTMSGMILHKYTVADMRANNSLTTALLSPHCEYVYAVTEDHHLCGFNFTSNKLESLLKIHEKHVFGLAHHPHLNILASFSEDGTIKLWKP